MSSRKTNFILNLGVGLFSIFLAFSILEVLLRIYPLEIAQYTTLYRHKYDPILGRVPIPNQRNKALIRECVRIYGISTNSFGMRTPHEYSFKKKKFRIAILGDSFTEAKHVIYTQSFCGVLEKLLGGNAEILNFGVGKYSTTEEYLTYIYKARKFSPDIVILAFLPANDFSENTSEIHTQIIGKKDYKPYFKINSNGKLTFIPPPPLKLHKKISNRIKNIRTWLKIHSRAFTFLSRLVRICKEYIKIYSTQLSSHNSSKKLDLKRKEDNIPWYKYPRYMGFEVYRKPKQKVWKKAYEITKKLILALNEEVLKDGKRFMVVILNVPLQVDPNPSKRLYDELGILPPSDFDVFYPVRFIQNLCKEYNIPCIDTTRFFIKYRERYNIPYPYFSYRCDGHWNPLGHFLCGNLILQGLLSYNFFPPGIIKDKGSLIKKIRKNLTTPPYKILKKSGYEKIYHRGVYIEKEDITY